MAFALYFTWHYRASLGQSCGISPSQPERKGEICNPLPSLPVRVQSTAVSYGNVSVANACIYVYSECSLHTLGSAAWVSSCSSSLLTSVTPRLSPKVPCTSPHISHSLVTLGWRVEIFWQRADLDGAFAVTIFQLLAHTTSHS